jgi:lipopolysaccharide export system permease protein
MRDGDIQRRRAKETDPAIVLFDQYAFDLTRLAPAPQVLIGLHEKFLWDLVFPSPDDPILKSSPAQFQVELHDRLLAPLYPLAFGMIAFAFLGFPQTARQSRAASLFAASAGVAGLRIAGFATEAVALGDPRALVAVYVMIAAAIAFGSIVIWRGIPLDIDDKINLGVVARRGLLTIERLAARVNIHVPTQGLLRRLERSD